MRILLVNDRALEDGWGAETYLRRLAEGLQAAGDVVEVVAGAVTHHGAGKLLDVWDPAARRLVARRARTFGADVVHHHNVLRELSASVLGVPGGVPTVLTVHDLRLTGARDHAAGDVRAAPSLLKSQLDRRIARRTVDAALAVSEPIARALRRAGFRGVSVVPVPVDPPVSPPVDVGTCRDVVYAGRLAADKGVDVLIDAFATVVESHPDASLLIAGSGEQDGALRARAASLGERVRFLGRLPAAELSALLGRARVVAVPSVPARRPEGSPLAVVEAAMHGRPIVASDDPGIAALVGELGCGVTVAAGDAAALADALRTVLSDDDAAGRYAAAGAAAAAERHSVTAVTRAVREVYAGLVGPPPGSPPTRQQSGMTTRPPLSVVIPTRERPTWLQACLDALLPLLDERDEVVVVDSASPTPATGEVARAAGVRLVVADRPGASLARNLGWQAATHDLIAFVDDDVTPLDGWPAAVVDALSRPGVTWMTGWIGVAPHQIHLPEPTPVMLSVVPRLLDRDSPGALGASANCGFLRSVLEASGGFSERFGPGTWVAAAEDQELFDRLVAAGHAGYYEPAARVYHDQWRTRRQALRLHWNYGKGMGARLARLWRNDRRVARRVTREAVVADALTSMVRALRAGYQTGAVFAMLRLLGMATTFTARVWRP